MMVDDADNAKKRIDELSKLIQHYDDAYYNDNQSEIDDASYDALRQELQALEQKYPALKQADSASDKVGVSPHKAFSKVTHLRPMLSLDNAFTEGELAEFMRKMQDFLKLSRDEFMPLLAELKIDGLSAAIHYKNGKLDYALTRGDGETGEDITANIKTIKVIPHQLSGNAPKYLEIRGEIFFEKQDFAKLNQSLADDGKKQFSTARNAASGSLRQLDASITASRVLKCFAYTIGEVSDDFSTKDGEDILQKLQSFGLPVNPYRKLCDSMPTLLAFYDEVAAKRDSLPYEIDGMVYKLNDLALRERLGVVARYPRWAIAHKFPAIKKITTLNAITIQVGRTGSLTPVAELEPVFINGVKIQRASLHNDDEIKRKDIRVGDRVEIQRAGDVIPQITRSIDAENRAQNPNEKNMRAEFMFPQNCPECGTKTVRVQDEAAIRCPNWQCPAQQLEAMKHLVSREAFNIDGLGEQQLKLFIEQGFLTSLADIFRLYQHRDKILSLEGFQEKSVNNLMQSIDTTKNNVSLDKFIYALGIRHIGTITAKDLGFAYSTIENLQHAWHNLDEDAHQQFIINIEGCSYKVLEAIQDFMGKQASLFDDLCAVLNIKPLIRTNDGAFAGKKILFTGTLEKLSRSEAKVIAEKAGASIVSGVSAKLDYLVVGANPGSKLTKAQALNITILSEQEFIDAIN
ncbi:MAG: NAD-dependent DNA ligase LigA [Alphaproteobacteria bacterium]|nr:NAD-dependent DNA ligase LigA [Alphaproteobacteria bacterium]